MFRRALAVLAVSLAPTVALADNVGAPGSVAELEVNTTSADTYLQYHGRVVIEGKSSREYRWGGTSCGTRVLSDAQVALLQRALERRQTTVIPRYQLGQGVAHCLVGFTLVD